MSDMQFKFFSMLVMPEPFDELFVDGKHEHFSIKVQVWGHMDSRAPMYATYEIRGLDIN